jgi:hypothetical protein
MSVRAVEAYRVVWRRGSLIFKMIGLQMAVKLTALLNVRALPPGRCLVLISVRGRGNTMAIVRLEGLRQTQKSNYLIGNRTHDLPACTVVL